MERGRFDRQERGKGRGCRGGARGVATARGSFMLCAGFESRRWRAGVVDRRFGSYDLHVCEATLAMCWRISLHHGPASQSWSFEIAQPSAAPQTVPKVVPMRPTQHEPHQQLQPKLRAEMSPVRQMGAPDGSCGPKCATPKSTSGENPVTGLGGAGKLSYHHPTNCPPTLLAKPLALARARRLHHRPILPQTMLRLLRNADPNKHIMHQPTEGRKPISSRVRLNPRAYQPVRRQVRNQPHLSIIRRPATLQLRNAHPATTTEHNWLKVTGRLPAIRAMTARNHSPALNQAKPQDRQKLRSRSALRPVAKAGRQWPQTENLFRASQRQDLNLLNYPF